MIATLDLGLDVLGDQGGRVLTEEHTMRWAPASGALKREVLTLAAGANTITPPTGAKSVLLILGTAESLALKGIAADTGIALTPASNPVGFDAFLPLASVTSFVITNGEASSQAITAIWL